MADLHDFETHRSYLTRLAYRMLGSVADAQDIVQEAYLRWHGSARQDVRQPRAFLSRIVTRLSLDSLKSARRRRETYVGPWLPEPVVHETGFITEMLEDDPAEISIALMLALEKLSPLERASFILHDIFDVGFDEIAAIINRNEAACRQLAARARTHIRSERPRFKPKEQEAGKFVQAFLLASRQGDETALRSMLAEDALLLTDGGGKKPSAINPLHGADRTSRFFTGFARKNAFKLPEWHLPIEINGMPGFLSVEAGGTFQTTALDIQDGLITGIYVTRNPDKLKHLLHLVPDEIRQKLID
ncbi:MAG: sigma-70 family RNA polymerase sigma factor [Phyllobacterium sp.]